MTEKYIDLNTELQYLKDSVDISYLLDSLGFKVRENSHEFRGPCIIHGGDNATSFRFNKKNRCWICFSHKCHEELGLGYDIIALIRAVNKCSFKDAVDYLRRLCGVTEVNTRKLHLYKIEKERKNFMNQYIRPEKPRIVAEDKLAIYKEFRSNYFLTKGFKRETLDYFEIAGGYVDKHSNIRDIIPIRDIDGVLQGYSLREIRDNIDDDYKYILTENFEKDKILYNLHRILHLSDKYPLIIVEGFKSVWRLKEYGIDSVVAVMGSSITPGQVEVVCQSGFRKVIVMFDNDAAGVTGALSAVALLKNKVNTNVVFITEVDERGKGLDPSDLTKEQVYNYIGGFK